jgi:hypothetical protein
MTGKRKKQSSDIFFFNDEVSDKHKHLEELRLKYSEISNKIKSDIDSVSVNMPMEELLRRMMSLPLDDLNDLYAAEHGKRLSFTKLNIKREKIVKQNRLREMELNKIKNQISLGEIDVTLAKINSVLKKFDA